VRSGRVRSTPDRHLTQPAAEQRVMPDQNHIKKTIRRTPLAPNTEHATMRTFEIRGTISIQPAPNLKDQPEIEIDLVHIGRELAGLTRREKSHR
jgi:hypothetical protein